MNLSQRSDEEVLAFSVNDPDAFLMILDRHFDRMGAYIARRSEPSRAEELTTEVFVRAFANRRRYRRGTGEVLAWLYGIATNVLREARREKRRELDLLARIEATAQDERSPGPNDRAIGPVVASALLGLSEHEREPLLLYALADLDYAQIAAALDAPVGTIKSRMNRAREHLRRQLDQAAAVQQRAMKEGVQDG